MKQYYIFIENEQQGPFNIEELIARKISRETKVWFEGLAEWKNAEEIEELKPIFISIPPPINSFTSKPPAPKFENKQNVEVEIDGEDSKIFGFKKNIFYAVLGVLVIILVLVYYNNVQENNRIQNQQAETYNQQLEQQQKEINEQNNRLEEQEKVEAERVAKENELNKQKYIDELIKVYNVRNAELENAKRKLIEVSSFQLLRTASEKSEQVLRAQEKVEWLNGKVEAIKEEMKKINPEYEF